MAPERSAPLEEGTKASTINTLLVLLVVCLASGAAVFGWQQSNARPAQVSASAPRVAKTQRERAEKHLLNAVSKDAGMPPAAKFRDTRYFTSNLVFSDGQQVTTVHTVCGVTEPATPAVKSQQRRFVASVAFSPNDMTIPSDSTVITWDLAAKEASNCRDIKVRMQ